MNSTLLPPTPAHSAQPLTTFTPFPKLPIELRLKIFKLALPTGPNGFRMLKVNVEATVAEPKKLTTEGYLQYQWVFSLQNNDHVFEIKEVALSATSKESRAAYLEIFRHALRGQKSSLIRFGGDDVIYIRNFHKFIMSEFAYTPITNDSTTQSLLYGCQRLALPFQLFSPVGGWKVKWESLSHPTICSQITAFKNLKGIMGILPQTFPPIPTNRESSQVYTHSVFREGLLSGDLAHCLSNQFDWVRKSLEKYKAAHRPSFEIPELQVMDTSGNSLREQRGAGTVNEILRIDETLKLLAFVLDKIEKGEGLRQ